MTTAKNIAKSKTKVHKKKNEEIEKQVEVQEDNKERQKHLRHALANFMNPEIEEERVKQEKQQEQEREHKELEKQTRYILKSVKLVSTKNYTTALSLSAVEKFDLTQKLANLWSFIAYYEREIRRSKVLNVVFMCIYFSQLFSISVSSISPSVDETSLNILYFITRSSRVIPMIATLNNADIIGLIVIIFLCIGDAIFFYCAWDLSTSSTKEEENNYKLKNVKSKIVSFFFEIYRWFLIIPKLDIALGGLFCGVLHDTNVQSNVDRCKDMLSFTAYKEIIAIFSIIQMISIIISTYLFVIVYNTASFMPTNPIKPRYSNKKFIEIFLVFIFILFSYPQIVPKQVVVLVMQHLIGFYYQLEYFLQFPLLTREYTTIYANIINTYAFACLLQTIRHSDHTFHDQNFIVYLTIVSTFLMALQQSYMTFQLNRIRAFDLRDSVRFPQLACLYFEELLFLSKNSLREKKMYLIVLGMLEFHQQRCRDTKCPCLKVQSFEDYGFDIPLQEAKQLNTPIGLYLYNLSKDHGCTFIDTLFITTEIYLRKILISIKVSQLILTQNQINIITLILLQIYFTSFFIHYKEFVAWVMKFVDYHIRDLINQLEKTHIENNQIYQDVSMRFWFFAIRTQKNVIKALFSLKANSKKFYNKSKFFEILELATGRIIENTIKTRDKSMKYSYRQKDAEKARQFELFEHMVSSEAIKKNIKKYLIEILNKKQEMMQRLIDGYESFNDLFKEALELLKEIEKLENILRNELSFRKDNIEYLRLLSILKIRLLNDPITCKELDKKIIEINDRDKFQDENTINSLNLLRGNVVSMISGFSTEIASILAFSESSPSFFGYKKSEFQTLSSLNDLIPECIAIWHDNFMIRLVETGVSKIIRRYRVAIAKNKEGFLFPINIYVNYFWHINYDFCFSALMLKLKTSSQFILVDPKGIIKDMSSNFYKFFCELYPKQIDRSVLTGSNIALIIPKLSEVFEKYNAQVHGNAKFEVHLPRKLNQFLRDYKSRQKNTFNFNTSNQIHSNSQKEKESELENSKQSVNEFISQQSKNYGLHYLTFEATCSVKQENIPFYNGGALILYLIEIQNYTPINPNNSSTNQLPLSAKTNVLQNLTLGADSQSSFPQIYQQNSKEKQVIQVDADKKLEIKYEGNSNLNEDYILSNLGGGGSMNPINYSDLKNDGRILEAPFVGRRKYDEDMQVQDMDDDINNLDVIHINKVRQIEQLHFLTNSQDEYQDSSPNNQNNYPMIKPVILHSTTPEGNEDTLINNKNYQIHGVHQMVEKDTKTSSSSDPFAGYTTPQNQNHFISMSTDQIQGNSLLFYTQNNLNETLNETQAHLNQTLETYQQSPKNGQIQDKNEINVTQQYNYYTQPIEVKYNNTVYSKQASLFKQAQQANYMQESQKASFASISGALIEKKKEAQTFNSIQEEQQLPFDGTSHHTEDFSQRFKELSKKSGTIITFTNQQSKSDGEHADEDDLNMSSSDDENVKKGWEDDVHQQNSVSSIGNRSTYNIVKQIHAMANEKRMPGFLMALYGSYTTQWALFILLSLLTSVYLYNQFQDFKEIITNLQFSSSFMIPLSFFSLSGNYIGLSNSKIITTSKSDYLSFYFQNIQEAFNKTKDQLDGIMIEELVYSYQDYLLTEEISLKHLSSLSKMENVFNIIYLESLYKILEQAYEFIQNQSQITEDSSLLYIVQQNYKSLNEQFDKLDELYQLELNHIKSNIKSINIQILIISILMFIIFSALIVPPFKKYRDQVLRILKTISRITEEEALIEIAHIQQANRLLESENEEYLITRFGDLQQKEEEEEELQKQLESKQISTAKLKSSRRTKQKKEKPKTYSSVYLNDRVKSNKLSFWLVFIIIFVLVMCSCVFLSIYVILREFLDTFSKPIQDQLDFSRSIRYYGQMSYSKNMLLISQSILYYKTNNPNYNNFYALNSTQLSQMQIQGIEEASSFLLGDFLDMGITGSQTSELKQFLQSINDGNTCELFNEIFLTTSEKNICLTTSSGVINIGLKNAITQSINQIKDFNNWTNQISFNYLQQTDYVEEIQMQEIVMKMFINLLERIGKDNKQIIDNYTKTILLIYILGGSLITLLFLAISVYSLLNTLKNFTYLRKAIFLIPFKRLSEDSNTRFLLKKFMEFQTSCLC